MFHRPDRQFPAARCGSKGSCWSTLCVSYFTSKARTSAGVGRSRRGFKVRRESEGHGEEVGGERARDAGVMGGL